MGYKAAVQILKQVEDLKPKLLRKCDLLLDSQLWIDQQKFATICHDVLLLDLEYALDKKVEQELWNIGFKNHIGLIQEQTRDKKNPRRSDYQALLTWGLEAASGYYLTLLHELCNAFDIDLPFRRRGNVYGQTNVTTTELNLPQSSSCLYICQYCLVHLGDIARYRNQKKQAENFYKQAILVSPTSGHPYNQLAILEVSQGDKLSTVFYYIRSIAVKNPFPASTTNLLSTLVSALDKESPLGRIQTKITVNEFIQIFLSTHALLHTATDLKQAEIGVKTINTTMTALVATQSFTTDKLIKMTAINLFALKQQNVASIEELTEDEKIVRHLILELLAGSLSAFLIPVHTLKNDKTLLDYYALPAVKILTFWIQSDPDVLKEEVFTNRLQIWPSLCKLLNNVQIYLKDFDFTKYNRSCIREDKMLQGFRPLSRMLKELNFKEDLCDENIEKLIRLKRIMDFGMFVSKLDVNNTKLITMTEDGSTINFEPGCTQPDPTNDLLEEMKSFKISDVSVNSLLQNSERRVGILKPQGSLEKSREERELLSSGSGESNLMFESRHSNDEKKEVGKAKRVKQNVAMQSIFKKIEENRQVKFSVDEAPKDKVSFEPKAPSTSQPQLAPPRTRTNQPAFPVPPNHLDYLKSLRNLSNHPIGGQSNTFIFPNTEVPPPNIKNPVVSYPSINSQFLFPPNTPTNNPNSYAPNNGTLNGFNSRTTTSYQNMPCAPGSMPYNVKKDDSNWWPPQSYPKSDSFEMRPFGNNVPFMGAQPEFSKPQNTQQAGGDMFNPSWGSFGRTNFINDNAGFDNTTTNHDVSMRQAMLNESNHMQINRTPVHNDLPQNQPNSPGYSLFNNTTWTPNLGGQFRTAPRPSQDHGMNNLPQHSLFTGRGPQSLAQLLEQQQAQKMD